MIINLRLFAILLMLCALQPTLAQPLAPADSLATPETHALLSSLQRLQGTGVLFGHHDDTAYGVYWRGQQDSSDVKSVTGSYPAIYGWDLSGIELDSLYDINGITFARQAQLVRQAYERGGINTFCWHMNNPVTCQTAWDTSAITVHELLPGGSFHQLYKLYLDRAARYIAKLKGSRGEPIPILFRPFHELTGDWFWWGQNTTSPDDFVSLWQFTINYLRRDKQLHNLLPVYSTSDFYSEYDLMERYPGDEYADVIGFDKYCFDSVKVYQQDMDRQLELLHEVALKHHKLSCIAETGYQGIPQPDWWTQVLAPLLERYKQTSYLMIWRNNGPEHYYTPYPGQASAADFCSFYTLPACIFQDRLTPVKVYGGHVQR